MGIDRERCALVLVDYQVRLLPAIAEAEAVLRQALFLAAVARELAMPVLGTEQNPEGLGPNDERVRAACDETLAKRHFDAASDGLAAALTSRGRAQVVVAGCEAHVCLMQTALGLQDAGFAVFVVPEACGSRRPGDKAAAMQRLAERGIARLSAEMVAFEWLRSCDHPAFARVLKLVKAMPV
ncbi:MAG: isochorismatase family protein [Betaproteobacteria bacterium]